MKKQYLYSNDTEFLSKIDKLHVREQWVKITLLEYSSEVPLESIEGKITSGTLSKVGDSAVRRTCNLSCVVDAFKYNPEDIKSSYSISKKIYLELGITNSTEDYQDEKIIWFPQGVFFITSFSISSSATGSVTINLQFKDKMAQLDGTLGGTLPATVRFDTITTIVNGTPQTTKALVYDIIMETVNHFGNENISNIIIDDIPRKAKRLVKWMGEESLWIYPISDGNKISYDVCFTSDLDEKQHANTPVNYNDTLIGATEYQTNQDIGYVYEDFIYDEELTFNAGSKVTDVLDKIKNWLGNYEYFYDEQGQFHFQEIKNYLNNSQSSSIWKKIIETKDKNSNNLYESNDNDYLYEPTQGKAVYTFDDNINLISITNTPVYENIKNDFVVEGTIDNNGIKRTCRYHLVIDEKPTITVEGYDNVLIYTDPSTNNTTIAKPKIIESLPEFAESGKIYGLLDEPQDFTFKETVEDMNEFATYYNNFAKEENTLIEEDYTDNSLDELYALLENYMSYEDTTPYKSRYSDIVFTLARQIEKYCDGSKRDPNNSTKKYYIDLKEQYNPQSEAASEKLIWCKDLLILLYNIFNFSTEEITAPEGEDSGYWPIISEILENLWQNINTTYSTSLNSQRKAACIKEINSLNIKQKQLKILIEQYTQIMNNCSIKIASLERNNQNAEQEKQKRAAIEQRINNYSTQQDLCNKRLELLYAILTVLGASILEVGEVYYTVDRTIPVKVTSFWYFDNDRQGENYGWNQLEWYKYYSTEYKSMTYIDYSKFNWSNINFENEEDYPSMNSNSKWYKNYYIPYAKEEELPYFEGENVNKYIPTDWRTELLLMGLRAEENGTDTGPYYQELKANLPMIYDFKTDGLLSTGTNFIDYFVGQNGVLFGNYKYENDTTINANELEAERIKFKNDAEAAVKNLSLKYENDNYYYYFDMIDSSSSIWGEYSVKNIGRRTNVNISDGVNCIFTPDIPNYAFVNISNITLEERKKIVSELENVAEEIIYVTDSFYDNFATGVLKQSAYEQIKYDLQQHTSYQNTVSITAIPCFYLEPNVRVKLNNYTTNTFGDYVIKSISIPLGSNTMSVSLSKAIERI